MHFSLYHDIYLIIRILEDGRKRQISAFYPSLTKTQGMFLHHFPMHPQSFAPLGIILDDIPATRLPAYIAVEEET